MVPYHNGGHVIIHSSKPIECTIAGVRPDINCGLWVTLVGQYFDANKCSILGSDVGREQDCYCVEKGGAGQFYKLSIQFWCEPTAALKNTVY